MILGLTGYAGSGKDTVADMLVSDYGFTRVAYADKLKELAMKANPTVPIDTEDDIELATLVANSNWDEAKQHVSVRAFLQNLGQGAREVLGDSIWINALYMRLAEINYTPGVSRIVLTDVRYPNEITPTTKLWRVTREGVGPVNAHPSETAIETVHVDYTITNDGTLDDLRTAVNEAMKVNPDEQG